MQQKQVFRRMNLDADVRSLQPGDYRKLYNGIPIAPKSSSYANAIQDTISNVLGNALVSYSLPAGTNKCIGYLEDRAGNRGFYFVQNSTAANNSIYQISGTTITLVYRSAYLDWASTDFIHADIVGDILIFTNGRSETLKINITKAIASFYASIASVEEITIIKRPPQLHLQRTPVFDNTRLFNYLGENYYQFYYRYIYEDNEYSVLSACSPDREYTGSLGIATEVQAASASDVATLSGLLTIDGYTLVGGDLVFLFAQTDATENGVYSASAGAWTRATIADTDAEIRALAVQIQLGNNYRGKIFRNTNTSAITIGATNITFALTEGPNAIDVVIDANENLPGTVKTVELVVRKNGSNEFTVWKILDTPLSGRTHRFYNDTFFYTLPDSETLKWNDSIPIISESLRIAENRLFLFNNTEGYEFSTDEAIDVTSSSNGLPVGRYPICHPKMGGRYSVGMVYFDNYGRLSSPCAVTTFEVPHYRNGFEGQINAFPSIQFDLTGITNIPDWATHYSIVVTEELDRSYFLQFECTDLYYYTKTIADVYTYSKTYSASSVGMAVDIRFLTNQGLGYTWTDGDRIKFYALGDREIQADFKILGQDGPFVFIEASPLFTLNTGAPTAVYVEIYTPRTNTAQPFYEYGNRYEITNPGASATLSQTTVTWYGDVVSVPRQESQASGAYSDTSPSTNAYQVYGGFQYCEAMNTYDSNFQTWVKPGGKAISKSTKDDAVQYKEGTVRFSQPYVLESDTNGLNTFNALDEYNLPAENGNGVMLTERGDNLLALFESETVSIYVGEGFVNTSNDNNFLAKTESVIGDDRKLLGGFGTQHPASVAHNGGRTYYLDARRGSVVRCSQDGLTIISDYGVKGEISTLCNTHIALGANSRIIGGWDPQYECYVLSFIDISSTPTGYTYYFHEKSNAWVCLTDLRPELWGTLNQRQLAFTAGALYMQSIEANYNLFFTVQYNRRLEWEMGQDSLVKIWDAVEVDVSSIYSTAGTNEDILLLYLTNGGTLQTRINYADFQLKEGVYRSAFFRSLNDVTMANTTESKYKSPMVIRSQSAFFVITYNGTDRNPMKSITVFYTVSMNSNP